MASMVANVGELSLSQPLTRVQIPAILHPEHPHPGETIKIQPTPKPKQPSRPVLTLTPPLQHPCANLPQQSHICLQPHIQKVNQAPQEIGLWLQAAAGNVHTHTQVQTGELLPRLGCSTTSAGRLCGTTSPGRKKTVSLWYSTMCHRTVLRPRRRGQHRR